MTKRKNLAVSESGSDSSPSSGNSSEPLADRRIASSSKAKGKGKERKRKQRKTSHSEDETEDDLVEDHRAGLSKTNGNRNGKGKETAKVVENGKGKGKEAGGTRKNKLAIDENSDSEVDYDDDGYTTMSIGSLHDADSEEGLGEWTEEDGKRYQMEESPEPDFVQPKTSDGSDGSFEVDIVIRWRWHPRRHFPQYRVKWTGYSDVFNLWEPVNSFGGGNAVEEYWNDVEHAGLQKRPKGWNKKLDEKSQQGLDSDDTERAVTSKDAQKRKAARKRKRRDIRIDRVETRKAYSRKHARKTHEENLKRERIEQNRKKKEQEEAALAARNAPTKTIITPAKPVKGVEASKSYASTNPIAKKVAPSKSVNDGVSNGVHSVSSRDQQPQQQQIRPPAPPMASSSSTASDNLAIARAYMTESDAKLRADKKKAKLDEAVRKGHLSISPSSSEAEMAKTAANNATSSSSMASGSGAIDTTEEKTKGAFRGAHKNLKKIKTLEPGRPNPAPKKQWDMLNSLLGSSSSGSTTTQQLTSSQEAMPPPASVPLAANNRNGMPPGNESALPPRPPAPPFSSSPASAQSISWAPAPASSPTASSYPSFRPMTALRNGPLRMGHDPRNARPFSRPIDNNEMPASTTSTNGNGYASPATGNNDSTHSPMHNNQAVPSPIHVPPSPLHGGHGQPASPMHATQSNQGDGHHPQSNNPQGYIDPATIQGLTEIERARAFEAMERWHFSDSLIKMSEKAYNFQPRYPNEDQTNRRLMQHVISLCKGGRPPHLLDKHKQPDKRNIIWIPSAKYPLSVMEREALPLTNIKFIEYNDTTGVLEIWPFTSRKIIMCTFGALILRLIEQCYIIKSRQRWSVAETTIMIHPWQKAILQQLIDADMLRSFLEHILGITDDVINKEFAITESGREILDDFEEVPLEYLNSEATGRDEPLVSELDLSDTVLNVDRETSATLHRLQYERKQQCRFFTLIMAKTRLACSEIPTLYKLV